MAIEREIEKFIDEQINQEFAMKFHTIKPKWIKEDAERFADDEDRLEVLGDRVRQLCMDLRYAH